MRMTARLVGAVLLATTAVGCSSPSSQGTDAGTDASADVVAADVAADRQPADTGKDLTPDALPDTQADAQLDTPPDAAQLDTQPDAGQPDITADWALPDTAVDLVLSDIAVDSGTDGSTGPETAADIPPDACQPACDGKECGDDGCGGTCGTCAECGELCMDGLCTATGCDDGDPCTEDDQCVDGLCAGAPVVCDDENACTTDLCDPAAGGCVFTPVTSNSCLPHIEVDFPPRAATLLGGESKTITVTGTVTSGGGPISSLTVQGKECPVDSGSGEFSLEVPVNVGANTLVLEAVDSLGATGRRVQGFHWSTAYVAPPAEMLPAELVDPGYGSWWGKDAVDDAVHDLPADDLATVDEIAYKSMDPATWVKNPVISGQAMWGLGIYQMSAVNPTFSSSTLSLSVISEGLQAQGVMTSVGYDLEVKKTGCGGGFLEPCFGADSYAGTMDLSSVVMTGVLGLSSSLSVTSTEVVLNDLDVNLDGTIGYLLNWLLDVLVPQIQLKIADQWTTHLEKVTIPLLEDALELQPGSTDLSVALGMADAQPVEVTLSRELSSSAKEPGGGLELGYRTQAASPSRGVPLGEPFDGNLGVPQRVGCGSGQQLLSVPGIASREVVYADDTVNQVLRAAWWGGLFETALAATSEDPLLVDAGVENLELSLSASLPPLVSDCTPDGALRLSLAEMVVQASFDCQGQAVELLLFASLDAPAQLQITDGALGLEVVSVESLEVEFSSPEDELPPSFADVASALQQVLAARLSEALKVGQPLLLLPLYGVDLSEHVGEVPGSVVLTMAPSPSPDDVSRSDGNTVISGSLE